MKKLILLVWCMCWFTLVHAHAHANSCAHAAPHGLPQIALTNSQIICRTGHVLQHDNQARIPVWVSYTLTRDHTLTCGAPRPDRFEPDPQLLPAHRAESSDYRRSGFDQGHMAPNADLSWHPQAQRESFYLSNITPQLPELNRGLWRELESVVRAWAYERHSLTIYVGPIYSRHRSSTIGARRVVVPDAFFKIVIDNLSGAFQVFLFPHVTQLPGHVRDVRTTLHDVQMRTNIRFPLPAHARESSHTWSYNLRTLHAHRNRLCG